MTQSKSWGMHFLVLRNFAVAATKYHITYSGQIICAIFVPGVGCSVLFEASKPC